MIEIDTRVSISLHPDVLKSADGYSEDTAPYVSVAEGAFSVAYEGLRQVYKAREAAERNPTLTHAGRVLATADFSDKLFTRATRAFDSSRATLVKNIAAIDKQLDGPIEKACSEPISAEIRAHCMNLPYGKRGPFVQEAIRNGDRATAAAILGAPAYLSGIEPAWQTIYRREWHEAASPDLARRLKVMRHAKGMIEQKAGLLFSQFEKAIGADFGEVNRLRRLKAESDRAFQIEHVNDITGKI